MTGAVGQDPRTLRQPRDRALDPHRTAVLMVDVQNSEITPETRADHPAYYAGIQAALAHQKALIDGARARGAEIIYTVIEALTADGRDRSLDHRLSGLFVPKGSPLAQVIDHVAPEADDIVLPKTSSGVFNSTTLDYVLRNLGIEAIIVAGFVTDQCVDMAIRDGADRGYYMVCAQDACATYTPERHRLALAAFEGYCRVQDVEEVLSSFADNPGDP